MTSLSVMYILKCLDIIQQQPNGGRYLEVLSGKDLYKQTIVMSTRGAANTSDRDGIVQQPQALRAHTFPARFLNIFVDYPFRQMDVGDKLWMHWDEHPMQLWQTQLNFAVWCTSSAFGVSSAHLNYTS